MYLLQQRIAQSTKNRIQLLYITKENMHNTFTNQSEKNLSMSACLMAEWNPAIYLPINSIVFK